MRLLRPDLFLDWAAARRRFLGEGLNGRLFLTAHSISMILIRSTVAPRRASRTKGDGVSEIYAIPTKYLDAPYLSLSLTLSGTYVSALRYNSSATWRLFLSHMSARSAY